MTDLREFDDVVYIAGRTFKSEYGTHEAGTEVKEASKFGNLQVLVDNHFLWPVAPDKVYNYLPAHLFNHLNVREEVMAKLEAAMAPHRKQFPNGKPPEVLLAEQEADQAREVVVDRKKAYKDAQRVYDDLPTPDVNPAAMTKAADLKKVQKGQKSAWEFVEEDKAKAEKTAETKADEGKTETKTDDKPKATRTTSKKTTAKSR